MGAAAPGRPHRCRAATGATVAAVAAAAVLPGLASAVAAVAEEAAGPYGIDHLLGAVAAGDAVDLAATAPPPLRRGKVATASRSSLGGRSGVLGMQEEEPPAAPMPPLLAVDSASASASESLADLTSHVAAAAAVSTSTVPLVRREREQPQREPGRILEPPWVIQAKAEQARLAAREDNLTSGGGHRRLVEGSELNASLATGQRRGDGSPPPPNAPPEAGSGHDYVMVYDNATCREDWIEGSDRSQNTLAECAAQCRSNATCKFFAFSSINKDCAQFWNGCTKDTRYHTYTSYKMLSKSTWDPNRHKNCSWSIESCKLVAKKLGLQLGDNEGGANFTKEYATKGCFTYAIGPYKGKIYYGTEKGSSIKGQPLEANDPVYPVERPLGYPFCKTPNTSNASGVPRFHELPLPDYTRADTFCGRFGAQTMGLNESLRGCTSTGENWTQVSSTAHGDACRALCSDYVEKHGAVCCYEGATNTSLGCWIKPGAQANIIGTGVATMCRKGLIE